MTNFILSYLPPASYLNNCYSYCASAATRVQELGTSVYESVTGSDFKPISREQLKPHIKYSCAAAFSSDINMDMVEPFGYSLVDTRNLSLETGSMEKRARCLFNPESGLKIVLLEAGDELVISFAALNGYRSEMSPKDYQNSPLGKNNVYNAVSNMCGFKPEVYEEASDIIEKLITEFSGKNIVFVGQSYGGSFAAYMALKYSKQGFIQNPVPLGGALQREVGDEALSNNQLTHISSEKDYLTDIKVMNLLFKAPSLLGFRGPMHVGDKYRISTPYSSMIASHIFFLGDVMHHMGEDYKDDLFEWLRTTATQSQD